MTLPFLFLLSQQFSSVLAPVFGTLGRDATFTGRANVWQEINFTTVNPLLGAGFWNFWGSPGAMAIRAAARMEVINAHDGYLDLYLDGGLIGLALLFLWLVASGNRIIGLLPQRDPTATGFHRLRYAFVLITVFGNLTESLFARPCAFWFTTVLVLINYRFRDIDTGSRKVARASAVSLGDRLKTRRRDQLTLTLRPEGGAVAPPVCCP